jgi:hypothetical protein
MILTLNADFQNFCEHKNGCLITRGMVIIQCVFYSEWTVLQGVPGLLRDTSGNATHTFSELIDKSSLINCDQRLDNAVLCFIKVGLFLLKLCLLVRTSGERSYLQ